MGDQALGQEALHVGAAGEGGGLMLRGSLSQHLQFWEAADKSRESVLAMNLLTLLHILLNSSPK